jgi:flavin-dependent thymidylate synthase
LNQIKVELQEWMGSDRSIAEAAWTSSLTYQGKQKRTEDDVKRVVEMLATHKHASPFESVVMRFWIKMPIQTDRQHMTHRISSQNGLSGRYRTMPSEYLEMPDDCMVILEKMSTRKMNPLENYYEICEKANTYYTLLLKDFKEAETQGEITNAEYKRLREMFRGILPQNNMTERVTIFNLRSFANYQLLRNSEHAQPEIRQVAQLMLEEVKNKNVSPIAIEWLEKNGWKL